MRTVLTFLALSGLVIFAPVTWANDHRHDPHHGAHQHGVSTLEVAVDGATLSIHLASPLDNVVGFEHAPRTAKQRAAASQALATLKQGGELFAPTPAAGCTLAEVKVEAPLLQGKTTDAGDHGDLEADYRFTCARPDKLTGVDARLFSRFPGMKRIDAAVVTAKGQQAFRLTRSLHYMNW